MSTRFPRRAMVAGSVVWVIPPGLARAQGPANGTAGWPTQPLRLVVPFAPGGTTDLAARLVAKGLAEHLGQPVIVDNRPGAGATLGSQAVAEARPDGYTLVMSNVASHAIGPGLYPGLRYDPVRDFAHIGLVISNPALFVSNKGFAPRTLGEVVAYSKTQSRGVAIASSGVGSTNHLLILQFAQTTGANLNHVPYRGAGPAMTDVIAGVVPMMSDSLPSAAGHVRAGSVRAMAMASEARHPAFPDIPTFREQGVDLLSSSWFGISAPAGTPPPILARLSADLRAVLASAEVRDRFDEWGATPGALGPEAYTAFVAAEVARWQPILRDSGARAE